ncbi:hypothetical protein H0W32_00965, partial [Patescibacteria group bacterium]|nr:hypothetical protein [Patescibacteria group bacterium]
LGMVRATAQGVRLLKSKLRFSLQEFSYARISLVRGKEVWRITNAKIEWNLHILFREKKEIIFMLAQIFLLLRRLIPGEEKNEKLFLLIHHAFVFLQSAIFSKEEISSFEKIAVINILNNLGYIGNNPELSKFINVPWSKELLAHMEIKKRSALQEINRAIKATQL